MSSKSVRQRRRILFCDCYSSRILWNKRTMICAILSVAGIALYVASRLDLNIGQFFCSNHALDFTVNTENDSRVVQIYTDVAKDGARVTTTLDDVTITLRTAGKFHQNRIDIQLQTWMRRAMKQTFVITDEQDSELMQKLGNGHLVVTPCGKSHGIKDLCCKTAYEFDTYVQQDTKWWCRFDDDVYLNIESLLSLLNKFDPLTEKIYLGRRSWPNGISVQRKTRTKIIQFASGGGYCISKKLTESMAFFIGHEEMARTCVCLGLPEDVTIGVVVNEILKIPLVETFLFHTPFDRIPTKTYNISFFKKQVTHLLGGNYRPNLTSLDPHYDQNVDEQSNHFRIHCILYPDDEICPIS